MLFLSILFVVKSSEAEKNSMNVFPLEQFQIIVGITEDLPPETSVFAKDDCICACRENTWSCTNTECNRQDKQCENQAWDEKDLQTNTQLKAFSMMEETASSE